MFRDPPSGHIFVFINRRRTIVKLMVWTRGGFTIVHKRLERGTFARVFAADDTLSGPLTAVLPVLLAEGRTDEVLAAVAALVARNETPDPAQRRA